MYSLLDLIISIMFISALKICIIKGPPALVIQKIEIIIRRQIGLGSLLPRSRYMSLIPSYAWHEPSMLFKFIFATYTQSMRHNCHCRFEELHRWPIFMWAEIRFSRHEIGIDGTITIHIILEESFFLLCLIHMKCFLGRICPEFSCLRPESLTR